MIAPPDYYEILNLTRDAEDNEVKAAYRKLALKYHPERNKESNATEKFTSVAEAYSVLSNLKRKAIYDQYGHRGLKNGVPRRGDYEGFPGGYVYHGDANVTFNEFFGTKNPFIDFFVGQDAPTSTGFGKKFGGMYGLKSTNTAFESKQDEPTNFDLELTLEELYHGTVKKIKITRKVLTNDGMTTEPTDKILSIAVKPGWKKDTKIVFTGQGDQGPRKIPADIIFNIKEKPHSRFKRQGNDLYFLAKVPLVGALVGFAVEVITLDDRILRIPINNTITPEYEKRIKGEGMPDSKTGLKGDLVLTFDTDFPAVLSIEQKNLLRKAFNI